MAVTYNFIMFKSRAIRWICSSVVFYQRMQPHDRLHYINTSKQRFSPHAIFSQRKGLVCLLCKKQHISMLKNTHNRWKKPRKHAVDIWEHTLWCGPNRGGIYWEQLSRKYICWRMRRTLTEISWWCMLGNYWFERTFYLYPAVIHVGIQNVRDFRTHDTQH